MSLKTSLNGMRKVFQEALHLSQQLIHHRPTSVIQTRQILQQNASGALAMTLLKVDKEIVYMKYEGLSQYLTKRFQDSMMKRKLSNLLPANDNIHTSGADQNATDGSCPKKARIAFMITKQQKQTLAQKYSYSPETIKSLKPTEALLIIENELYAFAADDDGESKSHWELKLEALVKENEALVQKQEDEQQKLDEQEKESELQKLKQMEEMEEMTMKTEQVKTYMYEVIEETVPSSSSSVSTSTALTTALSTEVYDSSSSSTCKAETAGVVLALYKTEEEAQECINIKLDLIKNRIKTKGSDDNDTSSSSAQRPLVQYRINRRAL